MKGLVPQRLWDSIEEPDLVCFGQRYELHSMIYIKTIEEMFEFPARTTVSVVDDDVIRQFRLALLTINFTALKIVLVPSILVKTRMAAGSVTLNNIGRKEFRQCIYKAIKRVCCLTYSHRYGRNERRTHPHAKKPGIITIGQMQD